MTQPSHIFIVGSYRTGTTLLRHILNASEEVAICGETHFLGTFPAVGFRQKFAQIGDGTTDAGAEKIVRYIFETRHRSFWRWVRENVDRQAFLQRFLESDRTDRALFDLVMTFFADGKPIRGEKTPAHIHQVPTLLTWFPRAKVVHTFRDPRAIFVSKKKKKRKQANVRFPYSIVREFSSMFDIYLSLNVLVNWSRIVNLHYRYQQLYPDSYYLLRYEDLVSDPEAHLQALSNFLGITFTESMLDQKIINSSYQSGRNQGSGFDRSAINRWQKHINPMVNRWFLLWCKKRLLEFGYRL